MAKTIISRTFTWSEWLEKCETEPADGWKNTQGDGWAGGSITQALSMAKGKGFTAAVPEAEALADGLVDTVRAQVKVNTFEASWDTAGSEVDIARFTSGVPECMVEAVPMAIAKAGRAVRIVVPFSFHSGIDEKTCRQRGAAVMALVYVLQQMQHPLEVFGSFGYTDDLGGGSGQKRIHYLVEVQRADEPADIGRIMFALAHPTMLRRLGFRVQDHESSTHRRQFGIPGWRGVPSHTEETDLPDQAGTTIVLPLLTSNGGWEVDQSIKWIKAQLAEIFG